MKIKFGIVGCGHIAKRHAKHISQNKLAELVAVYDINNENAKSLASHFNNVAVANSLDELISNKEIDILNICTPNGTHASIAIEALKARKHVLVEKPMALHVADCEQMIEVAKANKKSLFVVKQNRFNPPVQWVKKVVEKGSFGELFQVSLNCFWNRNENYYNQSNWRGTKDNDGGILYTQFSHFIDILMYLCGDVEDVKGFTNNFKHKYNEIEDAAHFAFKLTNGAIGSLACTVNAFDNNLEGSITLFYEHATLKIGGKYLNTLEFLKGEKPEKLPSISATVANDYGSYEGSMSNHDKVIENVVKALKGEEPIMTSADEGAKVVEAIEKFYSSVR